ncbi:MAG: hypothetical protein AB7D39_17610 [Pseudodesulfovibrio sp.]|uniref:hypothetical protein n=1 Tax=Pseudodesulfovibrio sp. TaxID=2035812 RepID=UPI003D0C04FA
MIRRFLDIARGKGMYSTFPGDDVVDLARELGIVNYEGEISTFDRYMITGPLDITNSPTQKIVMIVDAEWENGDIDYAYLVQIGDSGKWEIVNNCTQLEFDFLTRICNGKDRLGNAFEGVCIKKLSARTAIWIYEMTGERVWVDGLGHFVKIETIKNPDGNQDDWYVSEFRDGVETWYYVIVYCETYIVGAHQTCKSDNVNRAIEMMKSM